VGRHTSDPRGGGRYVAAAGIILLAAVLVVLGGLALYGSLP